MRLFIAINFHPKVLEKLCETIALLKKLSDSGSFTHRENLHLTLAFIGETTRMESAKQVLDTVCAGPFSLTLQGLGSFHRDDGDILWIGVEKNGGLTELQQQVIVALKERAFPVDSRPYKPHLTLGRRVVMSSGFEWEAFSREIEPMLVPVSRISLMQSSRINGKLTYTKIYSVDLEEQKK